MSGFSFWVWWYSLINSGWVGGVAGSLLSGPLGPLDDVTVDIDPLADTFDVDVAQSGLSSSAMAVIMVSRPMPPGRQPSLNSLRVVGAIPIGSTESVSDGVIERFGFLPSVGSRSLIRTRVCEPLIRAVGPIHDTVVSVGAAPPAALVAITPDVFSTGWMGLTYVNAWADDPAAAPTDTWNVSLLSFQFFLSLFNTLVNGTTVQGYIQNFVPAPGVYVVTARFQCQQKPLLIHDIDLTITVV